MHWQDADVMSQTGWRQRHNGRLDWRWRTWKSWNASLEWSAGPFTITAQKSAIAEFAPIVGIGFILLSSRFTLLVAGRGGRDGTGDGCKCYLDRQAWSIWDVGDADVNGVPLRLDVAHQDMSEKAC